MICSDSIHNQFQSIIFILQISLVLIGHWHKQVIISWIFNDLHFCLQHRFPWIFRVIYPNPWRESSFNATVFAVSSVISSLYEIHKSIVTGEAMLVPASCSEYQNEEIRPSASKR